MNEKLDDIIEAIDFVSSGQLSNHEAFYRRADGQIFYASENLEEPLPEDIGEPEKYLSIPHKNELNLGKSLGLKFTKEFLPGSLDRVRGFFSRAGAYGSFKFFLERQGKLAEWYEYERKATEAAVRQWCQENNIKVDG